MSKYVRVPDYEDVQITEAGLHWLKVVHDFDQGARSDLNGRRERVYHPGPSAGRACAALARQGLVRYALPQDSEFSYGVEATAAGCVIVAAARRAGLSPRTVE